MDNQVKEKLIKRLHQASKQQLINIIVKDIEAINLLSIMKMINDPKYLSNNHILNI